MESLSTSWSEKDSAPVDSLISKGLLSPEFYGRLTVEVAQDLLGKILIVRSHPEFPFSDLRAEVTAGRIVETEAYRGDDPASHSSRGLTERTSVMFGEPGNAYVYFIYGMYEMLNFVTEPAGEPGAVLIRAVEPLAGFSWMAQRRKGKPEKEWTRGPGRLCRAMGIQMSHNRQSLRGPALYVCDDGFQFQKVSRSTRVGISTGQDKLWRFYADGNRFVSPIR